MASSEPREGGVEPAEEVDSVLRVEEEIAKVGEMMVGSAIGQTVGGLWSGLWGGGDASGAADAESGGDGWALVDESGTGVRGAGGREVSAPTTRFEKRIYELRADPNTYCEPVADMDGFEAWANAFVLDERAEECVAILNQHEAIAELYERVVPYIVEEEMFWMRYFYSKRVLELEEERRKQLLERAEYGVVNAEEEEDGWGDDDWDDDGEKEGKAGEEEDKAGEKEVKVRESGDKGDGSDADGEIVEEPADKENEDAVDIEGAVGEGVSKDDDGEPDDGEEEELKKKEVKQEKDGWREDALKASADVGEDNDDGWEDDWE